MPADLLGLIGIALDGIAIVFLAAVVLLLAVGTVHDLVRSGRGR